MADKKKLNAESTAEIEYASGSGKDIPLGADGSGGSWDAQMNSLIDKLNNRSFAYDPSTDPLWQSMTDQYIQGGRRAMEDTMGQAAGLTGGYSSSYAQSVGQQQFDDFMTKLNAQLPTAYDRARAAYDAETNELLNMFGIAQGMDDREYQRGRDALADERYETEWNYQLDRDKVADKRYEDERNYQKSRDAASDARYAKEFAYQQQRDAVSDARYEREYADSQAYKQWQQQMSEREYAADQAYKAWQMGRADAGDARDIALQVLATGKLPTSDLLKAAGISTADAKTMARYYAGQIAATEAKYKEQLGQNDQKTASNDKKAASAGASAITAGAKNAASAAAASTKNTITDKQKNSLLEYGQKYGPDALNSYMEKNYKNAPNYLEIREWLKDELTRQQYAKSAGASGRSTNVRQTK